MPRIYSLYSERMNGGYVWIKIAMPGVWIPKQMWVYEETHPWEDFSERSRYVFLDGNKRNFSPNNIVRIPVSVFGIFNCLGGVEEGSPEITRLRIAQARLRHSQLNAGEKLGMTAAYGDTRRFRDEARAKTKAYLSNPENRRKYNERRRNK